MHKKNLNLEKFAFFLDTKNYYYTKGNQQTRYRDTEQFKRLKLEIGIS